MGEIRRGIAAALAAGGLAAAAVPASAAKKSAVFNVTAVHAAPGGQVTITSKVWVTPTQARADVKHPIDGHQIFLVSNGFLFQLEPKTKRGVKGPLPPDMKKSPDNFERLVRRFAFDASGPLKMSKKVRTESISGYLCDVHTNTLTEGDASRTITVWVPQRMTPKFPVKTIVEDRSKVDKPGVSLNQSYTVTITLSNIQLNGALPPTLFVPPKGYKIAAATAKPAPKPGAKKGK